MSSLKKDFAKVAGSNVLLLLASTLNNFVLPIVLSITDYANYKTYILYVGFAGLFHLGYVDGINIKYGGKDLKELDNRVFWNEHHFFLLIQLLVSSVLLIAAFLSRSLILGLFAVSIIPINMQSFFLFFLQAVGQFSIYAKSFIVVPVLMSITTCLVFAFHIPCGYLLFCIVYACCYVVSWALLEWRTIKVFGFSRHFEIKDNLSNHSAIFQSGFFIMMGTIVFGFFSTIGQWLIKWNMDDEAFAIFSMAASLLGFVLVFVNAVNKVFYPFLCRNRENNESHQLLIDVLVFLSTMSLPFYYILELCINLILPKYSAAIGIVKLLLLTLPAIIIIQSYYINLYKAKRMERLYLRDGIMYTLVAILINAIALFLFNSIKVVAIATALCSYIWFFFPNRQIYVFKERIRLATYLVLVFAVYLLSDYLSLGLAVSFMVSFLGILAINLAFYRKTIVSKVLNK